MVLNGNLASYVPIVMWNLGLKGRALMASLASTSKSRRDSML
jgi:hypothetical protein